jgi:cytochrome c biogenesis protein CcmG/thiol:disulfide interchange protein DsbE
MTDLENPTNEPNSSNLADPANPSSPSKPATASPARWVIAAAAGLAVALFAMPWLRGGTSPDSTAASAGDPERSAICVSKTGAAKLNFTLKDMNGASVHLADFKGRVILLNYWATWCGPCKVEIPDLVALQDQYKDKGFVVLGVSQDDDPETLRSFAGTFKMNYPILVGRDLPEVLDAQGPLWGLPTSYLIGRDGTICTRHLGPATKEEFEREIKALL